MPADVHYFGIRHHGPGSARALLDALNTLKPANVLIEGPADCSDLLPLLAHKDMVPPVALLAYAEDDAESASFWPFAAFSPEYQAVCWAQANGAEVSLIDIPVSFRLPQKDAHQKKVDDKIDDTDNSEHVESTADTEAQNTQVKTSDHVMVNVAHDPIGVLAMAAGYSDGESWWRDVIEENPSPGPVFNAVADAMTALRTEAEPPRGLEAAREAHMRLAVDKARKETEGAIAVVCGAWHVPALKENHTLKDDRALLKGKPKRKIAATWAPWTSPRLAQASGYGAGVTAPGWCAHLWHHPEKPVVRWIVNIARLLREDGHIVSTASLIETERLAITLAAMRDRPQPSSDDIYDAAIATLCNGNKALWMTISERLLIGADVGVIPDDVPRAPLLEDLQRQQRKARLKAEALDRQLSVDLRSDSGLFRSTLLHRLDVLDVPWGKLTDTGRSRGTFRENWVLRWEPEFAVNLVEHIVYGATIERAAAGRIAALLDEAKTLGDLAALVRDALTAQLPDAASHGIQRLGNRVAHTSDCTEMLVSLPPMADLIRYGQARASSTEQMTDLMQRISVQASLALPYAARALDAEASATLTLAVRNADAAIRLLEPDKEDLNVWLQALKLLLDDGQASALVAGACAQLLFAAEELQADQARDLLAKKLSPAVPVAEAAAFFEGFFDQACQRLLYDNGLRGAVDDWLAALDEDTFQGYLPLYRRVFSSLDTAERTRLLNVLFNKSDGGFAGMVVIDNASDVWERHMSIVMNILEPRND